MGVDQVGRSCDRGKLALDGCLLGRVLGLRLVAVCAGCPIEDLAVHGLSCGSPGIALSEQSHILASYQDDSWVRSASNGNCGWRACEINILNHECTSSLRRAEARSVRCCNPNTC